MTLHSLLTKLRGNRGPFAVLCACALVLSPMLFIGFLNDDIAFIQFSLKGDRPNLEQLLTAAELYSGIYYRPLVSLSFTTDFLIWGWDSFGFRLTTLILHLLNTYFVFLLARQLFSSDRPALISALLFGLHPIHETSLFWLPGRTDVLCASFFLLSILAFITHFRTRHRGPLILSAASAGAAFLSKEMAVSLPLIIGLVAFSINPLRGKKRVLVSCTSMVPTFSVVILIVVLRIGLFDNNILLDNNLVHSNAGPVQILKNVSSSLGLLAIPFGHYEIEQILSSSPTLYFILGGLGLGSIIVLLLKTYRNSPQLYFSLLFMLLTLAPVSRLMMRWYLYIPSVGFCLGLAWLSEWFSLKNRKPALWACAGLLVIYGTVLISSGAVWIRNSRIAATLIQDIHKLVQLSDDKPLSFLVIPSKTGATPLFQLGFPEMLRHELRTKAPVSVFSKVVLDEYPGTVRVSFDSTTHTWTVSVEGGYFLFDNPSFVAKRQAASIGLQLIEPEAEITVLSLTPAGKPNALSLRPLISTLEASMLSFDGRQFVKLSGMASSHP